MIDIDKELINQIRQFINDNCDQNSKLLDLHNILECKNLFNALMDDVDTKVKKKTEIFKEKYIEYLTGQKEHDIIFANALQEQIIDTSLSNESREVSDLLSRVIDTNTYFPIDKNIKEEAQDYLNLHKDVNSYFDENDRRNCEEISKKLSNALFGPCRLLDPNFDNTLISLKDNYLEISLYMYKNIRHYIGSDFYGERLLEEMNNLKALLDTNT